MQPDPMRSTAHGFWRFAAEYFHAAQAVRQAPGRALLMPTLQLYAQAVELALKAFLLKRGTPLAEVKKLSHRLTDILALARKRRLGTQVKLTQSEVALIHLLDLNYSTHQFRYIVTGATRVPRLEHLSPLCERLVAGLEGYCTGMVWGLNHGRV